MISQKFENNRTKAIDHCVKELRKKTEMKTNLDRFEEVVLNDLALAVEALQITHPEKLNLIGKMIESKPIELYQYNSILSEWLK
jgi:hypothetical protein